MRGILAFPFSEDWFVDLFEKMDIFSMRCGLLVVKRLA